MWDSGMRTLLLSASVSSSRADVKSRAAVPFEAAPRRNLHENRILRRQDERLLDAFHAQPLLQEKPAVAHARARRRRVLHRGGRPTPVRLPFGPVVLPARAR